MLWASVLKLNSSRENGDCRAAGRALKTYRMEWSSMVTDYTDDERQEQKKGRGEAPTTQRNVLDDKYCIVL